ncbi:hypothetical protein KSC_101390 [Ktedonobacter sp. SOSP1-52]|nr:hypothetical protein KSC_101390 [Ktedonobacter sp. SOSP1-52]
MSQERIFSQKFGFAARQIGERAEYKGSCRRFNPMQNMFLKRMKAKRDTLRDRGKETQHK